MSDVNETELTHARFREQIAARLTGGLGAEEESRFDAHAAACQPCAASSSVRRKPTPNCAICSAAPSRGLASKIESSSRSAGLLCADV